MVLISNRRYVNFYVLGLKTSYIICFNSNSNQFVFSSKNEKDYLFMKTYHSRHCHPHFYPSKSKTFPPYKDLGHKNIQFCESNRTQNVDILF